MSDPGRYLEELIARYPALAPAGGQIEAAYSLAVACYERGGKLLVCGNGGSAADAEHIVGELAKGYLKKRPLATQTRAALQAADAELGAELAARLQRPLPALSLLAHPSFTSAFANDVDPRLGFAQCLLAFAGPGDALLAISTSGRALNIRYALVTARALGLPTIGLTGKSGGYFNDLCTVTIRVPETETYRVQELHLPVYHALCAMLEERFFAADTPA